MRAGIALFGMAGCLAALPGLALSQSLPNQERVVTSGHKQKIAWHVYLDPACHSTGPGSIGFIDPPKIGRITVQHGQEYPSFPLSNPRSRCNTHKVPATQLIYSTPPGAVGDDTFALEYIGPLGNPLRQRFHVVVR